VRPELKKLPLSLTVEVSPGIEMDSYTRQPVASDHEM
jgi:hypothetical protein